MVRVRSWEKVACQDNLVGMLASYHVRLLRSLAHKVGQHVTTLNDGMVKLTGQNVAVDKRLKARLRKVDMFCKLSRHLTPQLLDDLLKDVDACIPEQVEPPVTTTTNEAEHASSGTSVLQAMESTLRDEFAKSLQASESALREEFARSLTDFRDHHMSELEAVDLALRDKMKKPRATCEQRMPSTETTSKLLKWPLELSSTNTAWSSATLLPEP